MEGEKKDIRIRQTKTKRWSKEDKLKLLEIVSEDPAKFEKPTAQIFYSKLIERHQEFIAYGWKSMRDKMRNLKASYTKAADWRKNTGSGIDEECAEKTIEEYTLKMCEDYESLHVLFGGRNNVNQPFLHESSDTNDANAASLDPNEEFIFDATEEVEIVELPASITAGKEPGTKRQRTLSNNSTAFLAEVQKDKTNYLREKLGLLKDCEKAKMKIEEDRITVEREKIEVERERLREGSRLREFEISKQYELNKFQIESEMAFQELELKYKYNKE